MKDCKADSANKIFSVWALFFSITLAICLTQVASEIYAPAMPAIASDFGVGIDSIQWSIALYMIGVSVCQLIYGPISEGIGRKKTLLLGMTLFLIGTIVCLQSVNIQMLLFGRLLQGAGAAASAALWRSIFRDLFQGEDLARYGAYLGSIIVFIVPSAPLLGGYLQTFFGWRSCFLFMCLYVIATILIVFLVLIETNKDHHVNKLSLRFALGRYKELMLSRAFMFPALACCLTYGSFFAWFVTGPVLLIQQIGISPVSFGWLTFFSAGITYSLASLLNGRKVKSWGSHKMLAIGWSLMIGSGAVLAFLQFLFGLTLWGVAFPLVFFYFGSALIWPNTFAAAFAPFGHIAGYAGALYGFLQLGGGAFFSGLMSYLPDGNIYPCSFVMTLSAIAAWLMYRLSRCENR